MSLTYPVAAVLTKCRYWLSFELIRRRHPVVGFLSALTVWCCTLVLAACGKDTPTYIDEWTKGFVITRRPLVNDIVAVTVFQGAEREELVKSIGKATTIGTVSILKHDRPDDMLQIVKAKNVQTLSLRGCVIRETTVESIAELQTVKALYLWNCKIETESLTVLARKSKATTISMQQQLINPQDIVALSCSKTLETFIFSGSRLSADCIGCLSKLDRAVNLYCSGKEINDSNVQVFLKLPRLRHIGIEDSDLSVVGLRQLMSIKGLESVLFKTGKVDAMHIDSLKKEYPNVRILTDTFEKVGKR